MDMPGDAFISGQEHMPDATWDVMRNPMPMRIVLRNTLNKTMLPSIRVARRNAKVWRGGNTIAPLSFADDGVEDVGF